MGIVESADVLGGKPRIEGTRVSVPQVAELVIEVGESPAEVAEQLDVSLADVHRALAYYYDNVEEMERLADREAELVREIAESSRAPDALEQ